MVTPDLAVYIPAAVILLVLGFRWEYKRFRRRLETEILDAI
jgi:hypothetical protein